MSACEFGNWKVVDKDFCIFWRQVQRIRVDYAIFMFINHFGSLDLEKLIESSAIQCKTMLVVYSF